MKYLSPLLDKQTLANGKTVIRCAVHSQLLQPKPDGAEEFVLAQGESLSAHLVNRKRKLRPFIDDYAEHHGTEGVAA